MVCQPLNVVATEDDEGDVFPAGALEGARQESPFKINDNKAWAGADLPVTRHGIGSKRYASMTLDLPFGSQQNAAIKRVFLQLC